MRYSIICFSYFIIFIFSCDKVNFSSNLPVVIVYPEKEVYKMGEYYRARITLSDTSLFTFRSPDGTFIKVIPWIVVDGDTLDSFVENSGFVSFLIDSSNVEQRSYSISVMVPNPNGGDVTFSTIEYFYVSLEQ